MSKGLVLHTLVIVCKGVGVLLGFSVPLIFGLALGYCIGKCDGYKDGYIKALDDIRLGKKPRYKLVKVAEKWVEVRSE